MKANRKSICVACKPGILILAFSVLLAGCASMVARVGSGLAGNLQVP